MVTSITREELQVRMADGRPLRVVEALPPTHYEQEHLPGALNLPHDEVDALAATVLPDTATTVVVYCANGPCRNSGIAARRLVELGYTDVHEYEAGKQDWIQAGLPVEHGLQSAAR